MKTAIPSTTTSSPLPAKASAAPSSSQHSGHLAQLATMMNQGPRVQAQLGLADEIQNSEPVQRQMALAAEINQKQRVKPAIQMEKGVAVNDDAGSVRASRSQPIVQRVEKLVDGKWVNEEVNFEDLTAEQAKDYRDNMYNAILRPGGKYKLSASENRRLTAREIQIQAPLKEQRAQADDSAALERLRQSFPEAKEWKLAAPSHMGESATHGYLQNWEVAFNAGGLQGVLHLHFNTNERKEISAATLGRAHIKTRLTSTAGNFEVAKEHAMVAEAIGAIPKS